MMDEWMQSGLATPADAMTPAVPIQFVARGRLFTWIPVLPPRSWLGESR